MPRHLRENTLPSFALALERGAQGIELDVHATADGVVVVHHDAELGTGEAINKLPFHTLRTVAPEIPTLGEVCTLVGDRAELFVEIKGARIESEVTAALARYEGRLAIHSFDVELIARLSATGTSYRLGVLPPEDGSVPVLHVMKRTGALDVWPHYPLVNAALVEAVHSAGGRVIPWTVNDVTEARRLTALGVDGICTDDVTILES